jgi:Polysaccharide lyase
MTIRHVLTSLVVCLILLLLVGKAEAQLIWDGDASRGTSVFGNLNCDPPSSVTAVNDSSQGRVWRYYKPSGSNRCENHGIRVGGSRFVFRSGTTYYLGWRSRLSTTVNNNAIFQWKSYGNHIQNYPVLLKMINGRVTLMYRAPGESCCRTLWSRSISANTWYHYTLALHLSSSASSGWIEFWFNGTRQTLSNGSTRYFGRTLDDINEPKWGIYGASGTTVSSYADGLKVGRSFNDVRP